MKTQRIISYTLWANRIVAAVVGLLIFTLPALIRWYAGLLHYTPPQNDMLGLTIAFDCCAVVIFVALWNMEKLLCNLSRQVIFVPENVCRTRRVQWCCGIVAAICLVSTLFVLPMLLFAAIMGFLCLVVSVVASVLEAAVAIREENDLTI